MKIVGALAVVVFGVGSFVALGGCANVGSEMATAAEELQKKFCACADAPCMEGVAKEVADWNTKNKGKKAGKKTIARIQAAEKAMGKCAEEKNAAEAAKVDDAMPELVEEGEE
ncbi:MAG: hypothetical protein U0414_32785 [Polyangiaceae bacterium]